MQVLKQLSTITLILTFSCFFSACDSEVPADQSLRFAHITDPHLYDLEGKNVPSPPPDEGCLNFAMLRSIILELNDRNSSQPINFVLITGDIGVEKLIENAVRAQCKSVTLTIGDNGTILFNGVNKDAALKQEFANAAQKLAGELKKSTIKDWVFVNGNNDLCNENVKSAELFSRYMNELKLALSDSDIKVHNLIGDTDFVDTFTPFGNSKHAFIGFENGSWKNNQDAATASRNYDFQINVLHALEDEVKKQENMGKTIHLLFHVPDFDDPFNVATADLPCAKRLPTTVFFRNNCTSIEPKIPTNLPTHLYSAWLVRDDFRSEWDTLISRPSIKNLFAGHFHVAKRDFYEQLAPWQSESYAELSKYIVASPVAIKNQILSNTVDQARGFSLVEIDQSGQQKVRTFWADQYASYKCPDNVLITPWEESD